MRVVELVGLTPLTPSWGPHSESNFGSTMEPVEEKVDMPILTCIFFIFNWLTLTSEMHFVKFHHEVASCLLSRGKRKYAPLGMRLLWKYIRNYFLVYQLASRFLLYLQNYKEFEAEILDLKLEKYGLSFDIKIYTSSGWALGDENVIGIRSFKSFTKLPIHLPNFHFVYTHWKLNSIASNLVIDPGGPLVFQAGYHPR